MMNEATRRQVLVRIRRIAGQLEGVARMIEENRYCGDILLQVSSARAALGQAGTALLRSHVENYFADAISSKPRERKRRLDELMEVFARYGSLGKRSLR